MVKTAKKQTLQNFKIANRYLCLYVFANTLNYVFYVFEATLNSRFYKHLLNIPSKFTKLAAV